MSRPQSTLSDLARLGFTDLGRAADLLRELADELPVDELLPSFATSADSDSAVRQLVDIVRVAPVAVRDQLATVGGSERLLAVLGASTGLGEFLRRHPEQLTLLAEPAPAPRDADGYRTALLEAVGAHDPGSRTPIATVADDAGWRALRIAYRRCLLLIAAWDIARPDPLSAVEPVATALADLAGAALDAGLAVARADPALVSRFSPADVSGTRLAIIGMGKAGASELNYVSDVDVIFVAEGEGGVSQERAVEIGTHLAKTTMRAVYDLSVEPGLWEVDANLRPEGKDGALVRTLESHLAYYDRWAKSWEFQALLKARPLAGDQELGARYVEAVAPRVWNSASRENFVESVQRMRERVSANIPADEVDVQLKLGPGGLRDVEFTIQLLQLVHGQTDEEVRQAGTLPALAALAERGYIGRAESAEFARDYRFLRLLEHRLQLAEMRRTHLMPRDADAIRVLARATGLGLTGHELLERWNATKLTVRGLHERLFYRPLLGAVARMRDDGISLTSAQAAARLAAIGFRNPDRALAHIRALTAGVSRRAVIQRHLLPVMLQWFAEGADPDYGLLAFRRLSEDLGELYWFLRMLRDSSGAAKRLTSVLSASRFIGALFERLPEAAAWLEDDEELAPRSLDSLLEEARATSARHDDPAAAAAVLRTARRREVLRLALSAVVGLIDVQQLGRALSDVTTTLISGVVDLARRAEGGSAANGLEFGVIGLGRYGGGELGFGSDADVVYVYRATGSDTDGARVRAERIVQRLGGWTEDVLLPFELDIALRPEGKNGPVVRSLESYRAYYARWSLTWEAQALLRARGVAGDRVLLDDFETMADAVRYPEAIDAQSVREVKRIKARVESERLPQAADPARHLKLGRGSLSDVEWFVQLIQLQHAAHIPELRTTSTLNALDAAVQHGFVPAPEAARLRAAWILASRARSAMTLWMVRTTDVLPVDRPQLEGIARLMEYPPHSASALEDDYLKTTRLARQVFERRFYG